MAGLYQHPQRFLIELCNGVQFCYNRYNDREIASYIKSDLNFHYHLKKGTDWKLSIDESEKMIIESNFIRIEYLMIKDQSWRGNDKYILNVINLRPVTI